MFCKRAAGTGRIKMFSINVLFKGGRDRRSRGKAEGGGTVADFQDPPPEVKVRGRGDVKLVVVTVVKVVGMIRVVRADKVVTVVRVLKRLR